MNRLATRIIALVFLTIIGVTGFSIISYGEPGTSLEPQPKGSGDFTYTGVSTAETVWMVVQVIFFLTIIIGLFFIIIKFLSRKNKFLFGRSIRSLGGVPLGQNKSIQVVEIGRSLYIVGVGDNVQLMEKIEDEEEVAYISEMLSSSNSINMASFETFSGWLAKFKKKPDNEEDSDIDVTASFQQVFHNKLQHLSDRKKIVEDMLQDDKNKDRLNDKQ